jgi:hypothetical protein
LLSFSGYIAADELYDGPFCVLSIVDNHSFRRLAYRVLEHNPAQEDIESFLGDFRGRLEARGLSLCGVTTDGSSLYPAALAAVFPGVEHQVCRFHVLQDITQAILHALAKLRKELKAKLPTLPRGRPKPGQRALVRRVQRAQKRIAELFEYRHLLVKHHLSQAEQHTLGRLSRGLPCLRVLRGIMDEVYRLFDRRCRSERALAKLAKLRQRVRRFQQVGRSLQPLFSPNLEKALTFLDDRMLPSTSNAVERGNRRHRKMQKSVYSVRTAPQVRRRIALDMQREQQQAGRCHTIAALHLARQLPQGTG